MSRVLVTGSAGAIGEPVCRELLQQGYWVRAFDRAPSPLGSETIVGSIEDEAAVLAAATGVDAIVHLAAHPDDAPFSTLVGPNVIGLYNVLAAAKAQATARVVLASSVQTVGGFAPHPRYTAEDAAPQNHYALTKVWAERMGEMYARSYGLSVVAARVGWMVRNREEAERIVRRGSTHAYVSRGDIARFMLCALRAERVSFAILYAIGPNGAARYDLEAARELIGYEPRDAWPEGLPFPLE